MQGDPKDAEFAAFTEKQKDLYRERVCLMKEANRLDFAADQLTPLEIEQTARKQAREAGKSKEI